MTIYLQDPGAEMCRYVSEKHTVRYIDSTTHIHKYIGGTDYIHHHAKTPYNTPQGFAYIHSCSLVFKLINILNHKQQNACGKGERENSFFMFI